MNGYDDTRIVELVDVPASGRTLSEDGDVEAMELALSSDGGESCDFLGMYDMSSDLSFFLDVA